MFVLVTSGRKVYASTISLTVNVLAPAGPDLIVAEATVIQFVKAIAFVGTKLLAAHGAMLATAAASERLAEATNAFRT